MPFYLICYSMLCLQSTLLHFFLRFYKRFTFFKYKHIKENVCSNPSNVLEITCKGGKKSA